MTVLQVKMGYMGTEHVLSAGRTMLSDCVLHIWLVEERAGDEEHVEKFM